MPLSSDQSRPIRGQDTHQLGLRLSGEDAVGGAEHDEHSHDGGPVPNDPLLAPSVLDVHGDGGGVGKVP